MKSKVFILETHIWFCDDMDKKQRKGNYTGLSLPSALMDEVERITKNDSNYRSLTDFTKDAIREKLDKTIIEKELTDFEKIIFRDIMRQKRIEALKESMNFRKQKDRLKERMKNEGPSAFTSPSKKILKSIEKEKKETIKDIKKKNTLSNSNGHGLS